MALVYLTHQAKSIILKKIVLWKLCLASSVATAQAMKNRIDLILCYVEVGHRLSIITHTNYTDVSTSYKSEPSILLYLRGKRKL